MAKPKALLIRIDRLGDLVLTLPADQQESLLGYDCVWYIAKGLGFVAQYAQPPRDYQEWNKQFSWRQLWDFTRAVKQLQPQVSISFHAPWWVHLALWWARVPKRIGVLSQWHSFLFLNRGVRQKRSQCRHHELEYNHLLVREGMGDTQPARFPTLQLAPPEEYVMPVALPPRFVIVHPGMGGSALNWPTSHYRDLIKNLAAKVPVVVTGTAADRYMLEPLREGLPSTADIHWLQEKLNGPQLLAVLQKALAVVVPSTGVAHLSASLGTPTFGLYSPIKVERAERWGPKGKNVTTFTAENAGEDRSLSRLAVEEVYDKLAPFVQ